MLIYMIRHVESNAMRWRMDNPDAKEVIEELIPDSSVGVSTLGEVQIEALARYFAALPEDRRPNHGFSSPFRRTVLTGEGALRMLPGKVTLVQDDRLREIDFGIFANLTKKGRADLFPAEWAERKRVGKINYRPEGGENWFDCAERLVSFQRSCIDTLPADAVVLISTHETIVGCSLWQWAGESVAELSGTGVPSASITTFDYKHGRFELLSRCILPPSLDGRDLFSMESKADDR